MKIINSYLIIINIISFIMFYLDKQKAKKNKWRIAENTLWLLSIVGGSLGSIVGMYRFNHKTKHLSFKIIMPIIIIIHMYLYFFLFY